MQAPLSPSHCQELSRLLPFLPSYWGNPNQWCLLCAHQQGPRPGLAHVCWLATGHAASWCPTLWWRLLAPHQEQGDAHQAGRQHHNLHARETTPVWCLPTCCFSVLMKVLNDDGWVKRPFLTEGVEVIDWILPPTPSIKPGVPETVAQPPLQYCTSLLLLKAVHWE